MTNLQLGQKGEKIASDFLTKQGYEIKKKNYKCSYGEIDIIAVDGKELVFVEVKTRASQKYGEARESVNRLKKKHIKKAATYYMTKHRLEEEFVRFDVVEVYKRENEFYVKQIKNTLW